MGIISDFIEKRYTLADTEKIFSGRPSMAGISVSETTALNSTAVYACISLISDTVAQLPLIVYRRLMPRGKVRAYEHDLYSLLHDAPNREMSSFQFRQTLQAHLLLRGNAYSEIEWDMNSGTIRALWPLRPDKMTVTRQDNKLIYTYRLPNGTEVTLPAFRVWHIPGLGYDGLIGYSPIHMAREAIGLSLATEEFGSRFFGQGTHMGMVAKHPKTLNLEGHKKLESSLNEQYAGLGKSHRMMVLEEGMDVVKIGINPEEAQFLETRKFQLNEICRFFRVPPHLVSDTAPSTSWGTGIEQQNIGYLTFTIQPWLTRWEQTGHMKLMTEEDRKTYFIEHLVVGLLRADSAARATYFKERFYLGSLSPNDIREKENENPSDEPNADKLFVQANMVPIDMAGKVQTGLKPADTQNTRSALFDAVKRIAEREKRNILRQQKKNPEGFGVWLEDFYRDFPKNYIYWQMTPLLGEGTVEFAQRYIEQSRRELAGIGMEDLEAVLVGWEDRRCETMKI